MNLIRVPTRHVHKQAHRHPVCWRKLPLALREATISIRSCWTLSSELPEGVVPEARRRKAPDVLKQLPPDS